MASKRQLQVAEMMKRNFGHVLQQQGGYIYGTEAFVTVTAVQVTPDLSLGKIYLSVYNVEDKNSIIALLNNSIHLLKQELIHRIRRHVRRMPDIAIYLDDTLDEMYKLNEIFNEIGTKPSSEEE